MNGLTVAFDSGANRSGIVQRGGDMTTHALGPADAIAPGTMKGYEVDGRRVLVARVDDTYYALDAKCPHLGGDLSRGKLNGYEVTCPRHGSRFDVRNGKVIAWVGGLSGLTRSALTVWKQAAPATSYKVALREGQLYIEL
jgi:3-phenylpropionate/trans-cinnamate dioxygenase ferredoxin component